MGLVAAEVALLLGLRRSAARRNRFRLSPLAIGRAEADLRDLFRYERVDEQGMRKHVERFARPQPRGRNRVSRTCTPCSASKEC